MKKCIRHRDLKKYIFYIEKKKKVSVHDDGKHTKFFTLKKNKS